MARHGKKHKTGGKHRGLRRKPSGTSAGHPSLSDSGQSVALKTRNLRLTFKALEEDNTVFSLRDAARFQEQNARSTAANLRYQNMSFVKASKLEFEDQTHKPGNNEASPSDELEQAAMPEESKMLKSPEVVAAKAVRLSRLPLHFTQADVLRIAQAHGTVEWCELDREPGGMFTGNGTLHMAANSDMQALSEALELLVAVNAPVPDEKQASRTENGSLDAHITGDDSEDEEIVFLGRQSARTPTQAPTQPDAPRQDLVGPKSAPLQGPTIDIGTSGGQNRIADSLFVSMDAADAAAEDYAANIMAQEDSSESEPRQERRVKVDSGWTSSDLEDFKDLSTTDASVDEIDMVLLRRERGLNTQYLVVLQGHVVDEARWIPREAFTSTQSLEKIATFEIEEKLAAQFKEDAGLESDSTDEDYEDIDDSLNNTDDFLDEKDLLERKMARMSDERIARLLRKQEELGMGSEELILFDDGMDDNSDQGSFDESSFIPFSSRRRDKGRRQQRNAKKSAMSFHSSEDELFQHPAYNACNTSGFDIMDTERPSLLAAKKSKKSRAPNFGDLSDSDLERELRNTWEADREAKRIKKAEREEMRAAGQLGGRKPGASGFDLRAIKYDLEKFLMDETRQQIAMPPMDKRDRKIIHEISGAFGLKSKSTGSGRSRYPVLYKTKRTPDFDDAAVLVGLFTAFERRFAGLSRGRGAASFVKATMRRKTSGGGGSSKPGLRYLDGETVGAGASEIGAGNRGHSMLEKMGWSKGMLLGAIGNDRGIMHPIQHVVKNTKAGLG